MQGKQIIVDGQLIHYYTNQRLVSWDQSPVLLFLHGWMQDGTSFQDVFQILDKNNTLYYSLDLPGFWKSPLANTEMTLEDYWEIVQGFIEKMNLKNPYLIWHSFGWRISIYLRSKYTHLDWVVLIGSAWFTKDIWVLRSVCNTAWKYLFSLPWLRWIWDILRSKLLSTDAKNTGKLEKIFRNTISRDLSEEMKLWKIKTLIIHGTNDDQVALSDARKMHSYIQNSDLHILDWGHFLHQEYTQQVSEYINNFIET